LSLFILTEGLVVFSNLSIYYSLFFVLRSLKTAVNSMCLGTCSSCFSSITCKHVSRSGKSTTFVSQEKFKVFLRFKSSFIFSHQSFKELCMFCCK
jgi:hypothetical protein